MILASLLLLRFFIPEAQAAETTCFSFRTSRVICVSIHTEEPDSTHPPDALRMFLTLDEQGELQVRANADGGKRLVPAEVLEGAELQSAMTRVGMSTKASAAETAELTLRATTVEAVESSPAVAPVELVPVEGASTR